MGFKKLLKDKRISQAKIAQSLGITQPLVSKWVNGLCEPQLDTVLKLSDILGVSVEEIVNCFKK